MKSLIALLLLPVFATAQTDTTYIENRPYISYQAKHKHKNHDPGKVWSYYIWFYATPCETIWGDGDIKAVGREPFYKEIYDEIYKLNDKFKNYKIGVTHFRIPEHRTADWFYNMDAERKIGLFAPLPKIN